MDLEEILKKYFGYSSFKTGQKEVITSILAGNHTLAVLPTGTGKSLCYQFPGYVLNGALLLLFRLYYRSCRSSGTNDENWGRKGLLL